jgi:hypothetical protein
VQKSAIMGTMGRSRASADFGLPFAMSWATNLFFRDGRSFYFSPKGYTKMTTSSRMKLIAALLVFLGTLLSTSVARADVISVGPGAFAGATPITFTGIPDGTEVNGLSVGGVLFNYSLGNGHVIINGGPGVTNNINPQNIVSTGNPAGILTLTLSGLTHSIGYGYAILSVGPVVGATTITLFNGVTNVGSLAYNGLPDPVFTGGFAGIQSTLAFNRVEVTFNTAQAPAFALDNVVLGAAVPEPTTMLLLGTGLAGIAAKVRRRRRSAQNKEA